jgi:hypothetical protein
MDLLWQGEAYKEGKMIRMELDPDIKGDLAVVQVPWYRFGQLDVLLQGKGVIVMMGRASDYKVVAGNPARLYEVAGMLHDALHQISQSRLEADLD